ncbi:hypothetical protein QR680_009708 [Steinernema hermaphroditum]|uniref:Uncharacterized protein n=1 Tax=Steinernema hermaphroditum TaxID=289476 RepID=A0AA39IMP1_9BILA|nr:hypothetical protein QR680_009708 [Steinernema hermaphroditum]
MQIIPRVQASPTGPLAFFRRNRQISSFRIPKAPSRSVSILSLSHHVFPSEAPPPQEVLPPDPSKLTSASTPSSLRIERPMTSAGLPPTPPSVAVERIGFRYVWPVRVQMRMVNPAEAIILHISPKFATLHDHVAFQWTLKMHGSANLENSEDDEGESGDLTGRDEYVAISMYFLDGPVSTVDVKAAIGITGGSLSDDSGKLVTMERKTFRMQRGRECELTQSDRGHLSDYIKANIGRVIRLSLLVEMDANLFRPDTYLNAVSPTPFHSFLTANYRARASSKVWKKKSKRSVRKRSSSSTHDASGRKKFDFEEAFNRVMERERERRAHEEEEEAARPATEDPDDENKSEERDVSYREEPAHLFKKLLVACCESCERRASIVPEECGCCDESSEGVEGDDEAEEDDEEEDEEEFEDDENTFECSDEGKAEMHDALANMYFNRVALPEMEYVEDFADFLIDAELNEMPVLKRACERYLCGELMTKKDIITSLLLDLLFLAMVFHLPVMKSMTMSELVDRHSELEDVDKLLEDEEYRKLDGRIRAMSDRNLAELIDECKRFREQTLRIQRVAI